MLEDADGPTRACRAVHHVVVDLQKVGRRAGLQRKEAGVDGGDRTGSPRRDRFDGRARRVFAGSSADLERNLPRIEPECLDGNGPRRVEQRRVVQPIKLDAVGDPFGRRERRLPRRYADGR